MKISLMLAAVFALAVGCTKHSDSGTSRSVEASSQNSAFTGTAKMAVEAGSKGNLSNSDFDAVAAIAMEMDDDLTAQAGDGRHRTLGVITEDVWFERGKKYCQKKNWAADDCKKKLFEFRRIVKITEDKEHAAFAAKYESEQKAAADAEAKKKSMGY